MNPGEISPDSSEVAVRNLPGASDLHERQIGSYESFYETLDQGTV